MGTTVFTLCMRTGKKHTNPQWTPTVIECDSLCILSIAPGSWQLIGIYSSLNHWWTPPRRWVVRSRWPAMSLAMLRWHGTLILLTLKMRAGMRSKLEAPMQNDKMCVCLFLCLHIQNYVRVNAGSCMDRFVFVATEFILNVIWAVNVTVALIAIRYGCCQRLSVCRLQFYCLCGDNCMFLCLVVVIVNSVLGATRRLFISFLCLCLTSNSKRM